jgi:hypothetical protein
MNLSRSEIAAILILMLALTGCKKYEGGPFFSLRTKKERLSNSWKIERYSEGGANKTYEYNVAFPDQVWRFTEDGGFDIRGNNAGLPFIQSGEWIFVNKKKDLLLMPYASRQFMIFKILKLQENALSVSHLDSTVQKEWQFVSSK